jgi:hypothetical protein
MSYSKVISFATILCLMYLSTLTDVEAVCTDASANDCVSTMMNTYFTGYLPNSAKLDELCSSLNSTASCEQGLGCSDSDVSAKKFWHGLRDSTTYLCTDQSGRNTYINANRIITPETQQQIAQCNTVYSNANRADVVALCRDVNTFLECIHNAVRSMGDDVTKVYDTILYKFFYPSASVNNCSLKRIDVGSDVQLPAGSGSIQIHTGLLTTALLLSTLSLNKMISPILLCPCTK